MNNIKYLKKLERAVLANTHRPKEDELKDIKVHKKIMTSLKLEGDSKMGMILFVGVANCADIPTGEIIDYLGLEFPEEFNHKLDDYHRYMTKPGEPIGPNNIITNRTVNKTKIINNYLNLM